MVLWGAEFFATYHACDCYAQASYHIYKNLKISICNSTVFNFEKLRLDMCI